MSHPRAVAYLLLRLTVGVMFFFYGLGKLLGGVGGFVSGLEERFAGSLPMWVVTPFGYTLPFMELLIGALLILGLFTRWTLAAAGLLMIALTFGAVMEPKPPTVADNVLFAAVIAGLLALVEQDRYSLDAPR